jgi:hypothetical protein
MVARAFFCLCVGLLALAATHAPALAQLEMNSGLIPTSGTYSHTFIAAGAYPYHCAIHPSMQGTVTVTSDDVTPTRRQAWGAVKSRYRGPHDR